MKVDDLMTRAVRACTIQDSLNAAARIMWDHDCGCTPVVDAHGGLAGIVTDRDVCMAAYTQGVPLEDLPVERAMSARVISCARGDDLETAHRLMRTHLIHRLPVGHSGPPARDSVAERPRQSRARKPRAAVGGSRSRDDAVMQFIGDASARRLHRMEIQRPRTSSTKAPKKKRAPGRKSSADLR